MPFRNDPNPERKNLSSKIPTKACRSRMRSQISRSNIAVSWRTESHAKEKTLFENPTNGQFLTHSKTTAGPRHTTCAWPPKSGCKSRLRPVRDFVRCKASKASGTLGKLAPCFFLKALPTHNTTRRGPVEPHRLRRSGEAAAVQAGSTPYSSLSSPLDPEQEPAGLPSGIGHVPRTASPRRLLLACEAPLPRRLPASPTFPGFELAAWLPPLDPLAIA
eukprot:scaffold1299_cov246-Pinguiococcus_pyrenoidosus.AAC.15